LAQALLPPAPPGRLPVRREPRSTPGMSDDDDGEGGARMRRGRFAGRFSRGDQGGEEDFSPQGAASSSVMGYPLVQAAYFGNVSEVMALLREGGDIEEADPKDGWRPLHAAVMTNEQDVVEYLLRQRAEVDAPGPEGMAPLHIACRDNAPELVRLLVAGRANLEATDALGRTPAALCPDSDTSYRLRRALEGLTCDEDSKADEASAATAAPATAPSARAASLAVGEGAGGGPSSGSTPHQPAEAAGVQRAGPWFGSAVDPAREEQDVADAEAAWHAQEAVKKSSTSGSGQNEGRRRRDRRFADSDSD